MKSQTDELSYHELFELIEDDNLDVLERDILQRIKDEYDSHHKNDFKTIESIILNNKTNIIKCGHCGSTNYISYGHDSNGTKRYKCIDCNRTFSSSSHSLLYSSKVNIKAWFSFLECILNGTSNRAACLTAKIAPKTGSEWMKKIFLALQDYQDSIILEKDVYTDETYVHVDKSKIQYLETASELKKQPRGISRNKICIFVATDGSKSIAKISNTGRPQRLKLYAIMSKHIKPYSHIISDDDNSIVYSINELHLTRTVYKSKTLEAYEKLEPIDQLCDRLKFFISKHRGFKKVFLQDYLNLAIFIDNEKLNQKNLYLVTKKLFILLLKYEKLHKTQQN